MSFDRFLAQDRRLALLRVLVEASGYQANDSVLHAALGRIGHATSRDAVRTDLAWLDEQGLVRIGEIEAHGIVVATLTLRGQDVAAGRATVPGVRRPSPR